MWSDGAMMATLCGNDHPEVLNTEGDKLKVKFVTNDITPSTQKFKTGAVLKITSFGELSFEADIFLLVVSTKIIS